MRGPTPYCFEPACAELFPCLPGAAAPRLKAVPEQQMLNVDNQVDAVQRNVGEFGTTVNFVNTMRTKYCEIQGTPGIHAFLYDSSTSIHGMINSNPDHNGDAIDGVLLRDWLGCRHGGAGRGDGRHRARDAGGGFPGRRAVPVHAAVGHQALPIRNDGVSASTTDGAIWTRLPCSAAHGSDGATTPRADPGSRRPFRWYGFCFWRAPHAARRQ